MKKNYLLLWSLLAVAFVIFLLLSMCDDIHIGSWHLKSSGMADAITASAASDSDTLSIDAPEQAQDKEKDERVMLDTVPKTLLFIGDSMVECLAPRMAAYSSAYGHKLYSVIWYSSTSELYGKARLITDYIKAIEPDYIFLSLGGNELFVSDIIEKRDGFVKSIIDEMGEIPYVWIGPPNWKEDTGINQLIEKHAKSGCYFKTNGMKLGRKKDGAHPDEASSILWMDSVMRWIPEHARYVLPMAEPVTTTDRPVRQYIHAPGEIKQRPQPKK